MAGHFAADHGAVDGDFLWGPAEHARHVADAALDIIGDRGTEILADSLEMWVGRPSGDGHLDALLMDVGEAVGFERLSLELLDDNVERDVQACLARTFVEDVVPLVDGSLVVERAVVRPVFAVKVKRLDPAARLECAIHLGEELVPVANGAAEPAKVDKVKGVVIKRPWLREVVDLTAAVSKSGHVPRAGPVEYAYKETLGGTQEG